MKQSTLFGIVLGLCAGLLVDSCVVVLAYVAIVFVSPVLLIPPAVGIMFGIKIARAGMVPRWPWYSTVPTGIIAFALAVMGPYVLSDVELRWRGHDIPAPPYSRLIETNTGPLGSSQAGPGVTKIWNTATSSEDVMAFYRRELERRDWREVGIRDSGAWFTRTSRHMIIELAEVDDGARVIVTYNLDSVATPMIVLLAAVLGYIFVWYRYRSRIREDRCPYPKLHLDNQ